ncbi:RtcB family protein [Adhaeribacter swui]|uniref:3'-phosphate/5'-hydroxy nucleic acid ligase n=1 Tax=Adhaeribacter swui TaxID=2086471 RepID=A0A7G7GE66_9BACT|nr:RtcB family protein [Adhaeribacter swui]QNF35450.1 RtcB family protein [Adhaeribacter swui]
MENLTIFGEEIIDENAIRQIKNCISPEDIGVLTADAHYGYGHPIGGAVAYKDKISLSGVGFDIACGNKAVRTNLRANQVPVARIMDEIVKNIGFGVGRPNPKPIQHPVFDRIAHAEFTPQRKLRKLAQEQLGTVGGGNHYIDLFSDEEGWLWVGVHFGSRGFGHKTATGFIALSQGLTFEDKAKEGPMDGPPILFDISSEIGQDYIAAMSLAGEYAYAGRDTVVNKVLEILGATVTFEVHNHHNFAWFEEHQGSKYWVVRKGCTPAFPGQLGFIGSNMSDISVIIEGVQNEKAQQGLYSTVHGAGRVLSRRQAAGKRRWVKGRDGRRFQESVSPGLVDFEKVQKNLKKQGVELRGGAADEAPEVYKKLEEVLSYHEGTIRILHRLKPLGVAMAGDSEFDPYKD